MERLTIIVKATFALQHGKAAELCTPLELAREDRYRDGWGSLEEAAETAPYLPSAGVLARGHAAAPEGHAVTALKVRLALSKNERWILNKTLHVFGDRTRSAPNPLPFQRMPLIYERAYGGRHVEANPVGLGSGEALPNILDPADPARPAGFGPIARQWAPRKHWGAWGARADGVPEELTSAFDFRFFHAAPPDQQVELLRGDEWIFLEGMHPRFPWITSLLPSARGVARLYRGADGDQGQLVDLAADTLVVDADRLICSVVWRGNTALRPGESLARMRVLAGVETPGRLVPWPMPEAPRGGAGGRAVEDPIDAETMKLTTTAVAVAARKPIAPFALAQPGANAGPPSSSIPGAPWSAEQAIPPGLPLDAPISDKTFSLPASSNKQGPGDGGLSQTAPGITAYLPGGPTPASSALPFAPAGPPAPRLSEPPSAPIPSGLPFASVEVAPPPLVEVAPPPRVEVTPPPLIEVALPPLVEVAPPPPIEVAPPPLVEVAPPSPIEVAPPPVEMAPVEIAPATPPASASAPPAEPEANDLRATVVARLKRGEPLHDLDLAGAELEDVDFTGIALERRSLAGSNLARCNFTKAKLTGVDMRGADLSGAILAEADLTSANLSRATLDRAKLQGAAASNADLSFAKGSGASFEGTSLRGVNLRQARLLESAFDAADLSGANANKADLSLSSFANANLSAANLRDAKLKQAKLAGANVDRADLRDADLTGSNVCGVSLATAKTNGAILRDLVETPPPDEAAGSAPEM